MKFKFNPLTGEFNLVPDSGTLKQKLNWLTGEFNLTKDAGKYKQIYNAIEGEFNLRPAVTQVIVHGVGSIQLTNAVENGLLSLKAFGGTEQRSLPSEYTQLEYITLNKSFFDTGITPTADTDYELKFTIAQTNTTQGVMGMLNNSTPTNNFYFMVSSGNKFLSALGTSAITLNDLPAVTVDTDYLVKVNGEALTVNGVEATNFNRGTLEATQTIDLGCRKNSENNGLTGKLYYFKIWKGGVLVAHYIPCKRNSDNALGYYDIVNDTFGTLLTQYGTPVAGPNTTPTPAAPMDIVSNNGVLKVRHQSGLPIGYTLLDYIQSGGSNYIDTGIKLTNEDVVEIQYLQTADKGAIYGEYYNGTANMSTTLYGNVAFYFYAYNAGGTATIVGNYDANVHTVVHNFVDGYIDFDGVRTTFDLPNPNSFTNTFNCPIFGRSNGSSIGYFSKTQLYYFRIRRNGTLILDLIPAKDSNNNVGMYDRVSGTLFTESGTGSFIAGNTVSDPMTVYADGIIETIGVKDLNNILPVNAEPDVLYPVNVASAGTWIASAKINGGQELAACEIRYYNASKEQINYYTLNNYNSDSGRMYRSFTVTTTTKYVSISRKSTYNTTPVVDLKVEIGSNMTPYFNGGTATAEMLLKIGDYVDEQEILSGDITRKVGIKVLDGTEEIYYISSNIIRVVLPGGLPQDSLDGLCTHYKFFKGSSTPAGDKNFAIYKATYGGEARCVMGLRDSSMTSVADFKTFVETQYNAGTPVIVVYPLATPTTETVEGQPLTIPEGDSTIEITQASLDNLELEAVYEQEA